MAYEAETRLDHFHGRHRHDRHHALVNLDTLAWRSADDMRVTMSGETVESRYVRRGPVGS